MRLAVKVSPILTSLAIVAGSVTSSGATSAPPKSTLSSHPSAISVQSGFGSDEKFCAQPPLRGAIQYQVKSGHATIDVAVRGLPRRALVGIDWANNTVRGYLVGDFHTDSRGVSKLDTAKLYRTGETRGYKLVLTWPNNTRVVGTLWPCGPPAIAFPAVAVDPKVSVSPGMNLMDGSTVTVVVTGFGVAEKIFVSECANIEDANELGCGQQLAAQPFLTTGNNRSGSTAFVVRTNVATKPYDIATTSRCAPQCVIVATQGVGLAWAVAPITIGAPRVGASGG